MFDIGWGEMAVIAVAAIIFIKPKDLPAALKTVGHWVARARQLAREFQNSVDDMIRESELDKVKKEVEEAATKLDVTKELEESKNEIEKSLEMPPVEFDPTREPSIDKPPVSEAKPVESVAAPPADAPSMPLPSTHPDGVVEHPKPAGETPASPEPSQAKPQRVAGGQG